MTKREFFEKELKMKPSEIGTAVPFNPNGETEVTEEWLISFIKNLLAERNRWHTGTPAEEGLYVVLTKITTIGIHSSAGTYLLDWWDGFCFQNIKKMVMHNPIFGSETYSWIRWQKIELFNG